MSNRSKLADLIAEHMGVTKKAGASLLDTFSYALQEHLKNEGQAVLPGFGRLKTQVRPARRGRNPRNSEIITIPEKTVIKFKAFPKR